MARAHHQRLGPYELVGELGRGAMGVVYRGRHVALGVEHAVKALDAAQADAETVTRFQREAEALAAVQHPNLVGVHGAGMERGTGWFAMDLVKGQSLRERLRQGPVPPLQAAAWLRDVARGLVALHARGLVHRDVKPANVLVDESGTARLADLGLVRSADEHTRLTRTGSLLGTPQFMPPEALRGGEWGPAGDVYSLGQTLFCLLAGRPAVPGTTLVDVFSAAIDGRLDSLAGVTGVPAPLAALYERTRLLDPARRPDAAEVAAELDALLAPDAPDPPPPERRSPALFMAAAVALASLLLLGGALALRGGTPPAGPAPPAPPPPVAAQNPAAQACASARERLVRAAALPSPSAAREYAAVLAALAGERGDEVEALRGQAALGARRSVLQARDGLVASASAGEVMRLAFSSDGSRVFGACADGLHAWTLGNGQLQDELLSPQKLQGCALAPDGRWIALAHDLEVSFLPLGGERAAPPRIELQVEVRGCELSSGGVLAVFSDQSGRILLQPVDGGPPRALSAPGRRGFESAAFAPGGGLLAASGDLGVVVWDLAGEPAPQTLSPLMADCVGFAPQGDRLLAGGPRLRVWSLSSGTWRLVDDARELGDRDEAKSLAVSRTGLVATGHEPHKKQGVALRLWRLAEDGRLGEPRLLGGHVKDVSACAFSADGSLLVSGDEDGVVRLWWVAPGEPPASALPGLQGLEENPVAAVERALLALE